MLAVSYNDVIQVPLGMKRYFGCQLVSLQYCCALRLVATLAAGRTLESLRTFHVTYFLGYGQRAAKHVMQSKEGKVM
jgi:hypothetical protein